MDKKNNNGNDRSIRRQLEAITRKRLASQTVVDLADFRSMRRHAPQANILVVDDEEMMRNALKRILENEGHRVHLADDAMGLAKTLETTPLDLVLLDITLPWVDGLELCAMLKRHPTFRQVPLIFVSGRKTPEDIQKGFDAGCDDYITKPFELDRIQDVVSNALSKLRVAR